MNELLYLVQLGGTGQGLSRPSPVVYGPAVAVPNVTAQPCVILYSAIFAANVIGVLRGFNVPIKGLNTIISQVTRTL